MLVTECIKYRYKLAISALFSSIFLAWWVKNEGEWNAYGMLLTTLTPSLMLFGFERARVIYHAPVDYIVYGYWFLRGINVGTIVVALLVLVLWTLQGFTAPTTDMSPLTPTIVVQIFFGIRHVWWFARDKSNGRASHLGPKGKV